MENLPPFLYSFQTIFSGVRREKAKDVALCEGEPLTLRCLVAAEPKASIHWLKNDLIFMDDSRLKITTTDDGESTLVLDPAMPSDAGLYKVGPPPYHEEAGIE